jgi:hypothetical protein
MDNDTILTHDSQAECAYFITQGHVVVLLPDGASVVKKAPCSLGEKCLFSTTLARNATVVAMKPTASIIVSRQVVEDCILLYPVNQEYYFIFCELIAEETGTEARTADEMDGMGLRQSGHAATITPSHTPMSRTSAHSNPRRSIEDVGQKREGGGKAVTFG